MKNWCIIYQERCPWFHYKQLLNTAWICRESGYEWDWNNQILRTNVGHVSYIIMKPLHCYVVFYNFWSKLLSSWETGSARIYLTIRRGNYEYFLNNFFFQLYQFFQKGCPPPSCVLAYRNSPKSITCIFPNLHFNRGEW